MRMARTCPTPDRANLIRSRRLGVPAFLVALSLGCGAGPVRPVSPDNRGLQRVEVTTVTTGVRLDPDGYGVLNDQWDYGVGDGITVAVPTNGAVILYLRPGSHVLSLVGVAENCSGENLDDRPIIVSPDAVTTVVFYVLCRDTAG
jgi:hypothetical protein